MKFKELSAPVAVDWNVTDLCNLKCIHCYNGEFTKTQQMSTKEAFNFIDGLAKSKVLELTITGGEPFLRNDLEEIVKYASENLIRVQIATNGTLITRKRLQKMKDYVNKIQLSIDGIGKQHDDFRGVPGSFEKTVNAAKLIKEFEIPLVIATVVSKKNIDNLKEITELCKTLGAEFQRLIPLKIIGNALTNRKELSLTLSELKKVVEYSGTDKFMGTGRSYGFLFDSSIKVGPCVALKTICGVTADGFVIPCVELNHKEFFIGNVKNKIIKELWNSANKIREKLVPLGGECLSCKFSNVCGGGCKASTYAVFRKFNAKDPSCPKGELNE